ncbi:hypothetical protein HG530_008112 [Fusarium avenaceum]|nr:hypothetical protein HG530_008112 [Fusarium avenaceum]
MTMLSWLPPVIGFFQIVVQVSLLILPVESETVDVCVRAKIADNLHGVFASKDIAVMFADDKIANLVSLLLDWFGEEGSAAVILGG